VAVHYHGSGKEARALAAKDPRVSLHRADLSDTRAIGRLAAAVARKYGHVELLVNSAAVFYPTPVGETTEDQWDALHALNLKAAYFLAQAVRPHMTEGASVINIADTSGWAPAAKFVPYGTTKAGIIALTLGLARELAPEIRVNAVAPGPVLLPEWYTPEQRKQSLEKTLLKREGSPENVAQAVRFLAENDYITGAVLPVDGGRALASATD
jgi:NAD(P)-dependent dehydrogenase (short-subunit alcohol dehydrogenase family)